MDDVPTSTSPAKPTPAPFTDQVREILQAARAAAAAATASGSPVSGEPAAAGGAEPLPPSSSSSPTSLDTIETSVSRDVEAFLAAGPEDAGITGPSLCEEMHAVRFRHSGWWPIRRRIFDALVRTGQARSRCMSFGSCGAGSWIQQSAEDPTRFRLRCSHCHDRLCTPCANARSVNLSQALLHQMADRPMTFITLTLCGKGERLTDLIDRLYKHFRALRLHPLWADAVQGGAAFLEVKWSDKAQRWHPHLHVICESKFIDQGELSAVWRGITRDSFIVDIRKVRDSDVSARYVTKYASKPLNSSFGNTPKLLDEAVLALKGRRLCLCFGTWYGTPLDALEDTELADDLVDLGQWNNIASLEETLAAATAGNAAAIELLRAIDAETRWRASLTLPSSP